MSLLKPSTGHWRFACLGLALPLFSAVPLRVDIVRATVTWGSGMSPRGGLPPGHFEALVRLGGRRLHAHPVFRAWRVKINDFPELETKKAKCPAPGKTHRLEATATAGADGGWMLHGTWIGAPDVEDRLVVEVCEGTRRLGWASSGLTELALPATGKPPGSARDD